MKKFIIYLPEEVHEALRKEAYTMKVSIASIVRVAIEQYQTKQNIAVAKRKEGSPQIKGWRKLGDGKNK